MATRIYFSGDLERSLTVEEVPSQVEDAMTQAKGLPFRLTGSDGAEVWISPRNIAYWIEQKTGGSMGVARGQARRMLPDQF